MLDHFKAPRLHSGMHRKALLALAAVVVVGLVCVGFVLLGGRGSSAITVRLITRMPWYTFGEGELASFEYTNATRTRYRVFPIAVEYREKNLWKSCFDCDPGVNPPKEFLSPRDRIEQSFFLTKLPRGAAVRLRYRVESDLPGLKGFYRRFELRFGSGQKEISLNPLNPSAVFSRPNEAVSDEFTLPSAPPSAELSPGGDSVGSK